MQFVDKLEFDQKELRDENVVLRSRLQVRLGRGRADRGTRVRWRASAQRAAWSAAGFPTQDLLRLGLGSEYPVSTREYPV